MSVWNNQDYVIRVTTGKLHDITTCGNSLNHMNTNITEYGNTKYVNTKYGNIENTQKGYSKLCHSVQS